MINRQKLLIYEVAEKLLIYQYINTSIHQYINASIYVLYINISIY